MSEKIQQIKELKGLCFGCEGNSCVQGEKSIECQICTTECHDGHRHVFGAGNVSAALMFVGQNPGVEEVSLRKPFIGRSGSILDRIIKAIGFERREVYVTNVCKGYTDGNRTPTTSECEVCGSLFLRREIEIIQPEIVVAVGAPALHYFAEQSGLSITRVHGKVVKSQYHDNVVPMPHPAAYLRNRTMYKPLIGEDIVAIKGMLR